MSAGLDAAGAVHRLSDDDSDGGDDACWAHLLCPECGVVLDGSTCDMNGHATPVTRDS